MTPGTAPEGAITEARYLHKECGGVTIWDLSGGFCTACHAEGLDADDVEAAGGERAND